MAKDCVARRIGERAELLRIAKVDDQFHRPVGQDHVAPSDGEMTARHPEMLDISRESGRYRPDTVNEHGAERAGEFEK